MKNLFNGLGLGNHPIKQGQTFEKLAGNISLKDVEKKSDVIEENDDDDEDSVYDWSNKA